MNKARRIIISIISIILILLWIMKVDIPKTLFIVLMGLVLISQAIDEWIRYKETKRKIHLFIPITLVLVIIFVISLFSGRVTAQNLSEKIFVYGGYWDIGSGPVFKNDRLLVPSKSFSEILDFEMNYVEEGNILLINKNNIELKVGSDTATLNGSEVPIDVGVIIKDEELYIPLRFIAESLGYDVVWDDNNRIAMVGGFEGEYITENTFLYYNEAYGYTLSFPNSWKEEAIIETKEGTLYVYDKKSAERFIEDGYTSFGPVFEIRSSNHPIVAFLPYEGDYILDYTDGKYLEVLFGRDFQFYPETKDSYIKIFQEGQRVLGSFNKIKKYSIVLDDSYNYLEEIKELQDILENYVPENIFDIDRVITYKKPTEETNFLYLRNMKDEEVQIKIESEFDKDGKLVSYHFKNYYHELSENKISQDEAIELANRFVKRYTDNEAKLYKVPDLYPSLYEENKHETYGDKEGNYIVVVDLEHGFVEYLSTGR